MSYLYDYENNDGKKIPYDDIPISRNSAPKRRANKPTVNTYRVLICLVAILFVANIALMFMSVYYLRHGKTKEVNIFYNDIYANEETSTSFINATLTANKSAVCVSAGGSCSDENSFFNRTRSHGSGVIYRIDKTKNTIYFATCYHVVNGYEDKVWVLLSSQHIPLAVKLVSYSSYYDIAVLKYTGSDYEKYLDDCEAIKFYDSAYLSAGDGVFAVGNPLSGGFSVTRGIVSRINTLITVESNAYESREIQTDAAINPGNSGGGLFNNEGKFIGIVNAKLNASKNGTTTIPVAGTAYAIPSTLVRGIVDSIIRNNGKATYVNLGATFGIDETLGITRKMVEYGGNYKIIERDYVIVESITAGTISYHKLHSNDLIESIEVTIYENGEKVAKTIKMYNKFSYEDFCFSIVEGSEMKFNIKKNGITPETVIITASALKSVD